MQRGTGLTKILTEEPHRHIVMEFTKISKSGRTYSLNPESGDSMANTDKMVKF